MTGEEMERAIEFLLKSQAGFESRQATFEAQLLQTSRQIEVMATTHAEFAQFTRSNLEALNEHTRSLRETVRALTINQARTDDRVSDLEQR
jgi:polyhydroxyalkanoate synthesis regulator phasin